MANKHLKRVFITLAIRKMQIKTTVELYLVLVRMAIMWTTNSAENDEGDCRGPPLFTVGENIFKSGHCGNPYRYIKMLK